MILAKQIKAIRVWYGYSQEDFGKIVGVTRQTVAKWEKGQGIPDVLTVKKIADKFKMSMEEVLQFHEKTEKYIPGIKERYIFDKITVGMGGKIQLSEEVRDVMNIKTGDELLVLGDIERGIELLPVDCYWEILLKK